MVMFKQDFRACIEALQAIQKEKESLEVSIKDLTDGKDALEEKKITKNELVLKREVRDWPAPCPTMALTPISRESVSNSATPRKNSIGQFVKLKRNGTQASKL